MTLPYYSVDIYTATLDQINNTGFKITYPYEKSSDLIVLVDGVRTNNFYVTQDMSGSYVKILDTISVNQQIQIKRSSELNSVVATFSDSQVLRNSDLNAINRRNLYIEQELWDRTYSSSSSGGSSVEIPDFSITSDKLQASCITYDKIADGAIDLGSNKVIGNVPVERMDTGYPASYLSGSIIATTMDAQSLGGTLSSSQIGDNTILSNHIANNAVGSSEITAGAINNTHMAPDSIVLSTNVVTGILPYQHVSAGYPATAIGAGTLSNVTLAASNISGTLSSSQLGTGSVVLSSDVISGTLDVTRVGTGYDYVNLSNKPSSYDASTLYGTASGTVLIPSSKVGSGYDYNLLTNKPSNFSSVDASTLYGTASGTVLIPSTKVGTGYPVGSLAGGTLGSNITIAPSNIVGTLSSSQIGDSVITSSKLATGCVVLSSNTITGTMDVSHVGTGYPYANLSGAPSGGGGSVSLSSAQTWTAVQSPYANTTSITVSSTVTLTPATVGQIAILEIGSSATAITLANIAASDIVSGTQYTDVLHYGSTHTRTISWGTNYKFPYASAQITTVTPSSGGYDVITFLGAPSGTLGNMLYIGHVSDVR